MNLRKLFSQNPVKPKQVDKERYVRDENGNVIRVEREQEEQ